MGTVKMKVNPRRIFLFLIALSYVTADDFDECGKAVFAGENIAGGEESALGQWPWLALLLYKKNNKLFCGSTIISQKHLLTAAHCIKMQQGSSATLPENVKILLGGLDITKPDEWTTRNAAQIILHEDWAKVRGNFDADIAIILMEEPVTYSENIRRICLPQPDQSVDDRIGTIVGYGRVDENTPTTNIPHFVEIPTTSLITCMFSNMYFAKILSYNMFCAGLPGKVSCRGYSGGGFFVESGNGKWTILGIVSSSPKKTGSETCEDNTYSAYTTVPKYIDWIQEKSGKNLEVKTKSYEKSENDRKKQESSDDSLKNMGKSDNYITLIAPHTAYRDEPYLAYLSTSDIREDTIAVVSFKGQEAPIFLSKGTITQNKPVVFSYKSQRRMKNRKAGTSYGSTLSLLVSRDNMCKRQTAVIKAMGMKCFVYIQMDKPIYKPRDKVQFRIIAIDQKGLPYTVNSILVQIFDNDGNKIQDYKRHQDIWNGVFEGSYELSDNINLGNYKIKVIVDGKANEATEKIFPVQKYIISFFQVHIDAPDKVFLEDNQMVITVFAKYSFEEFVSGKLKLKISNQRNKTYFEGTEIFFGSIARKFKFRKDFRIEGLEKDTPLIIEAEIIDKVSGKTKIAKKTVILSASKDYKISLYPRSPFEPGLPYHLDVVVTNWNGNVISGGDKTVKLMYKYFISGEKMEGIYEVYIKKSSTSFKIQIPKDVLSIYTEISYLNSKITRTISKNTEKQMEADFDAIRVYLGENSTLNPEIGDSIVLQMESEINLGTVIILFIGRLGIVYHLDFNCGGQTFCQVLVEVEKAMVPAVDVHVYNFESKGSYVKGKISLNFDSFGENFVDISLSANISSPGVTAEITLSSLPGSTVGVLAFDNSLTLPETDNDFDKAIIKKELTKFIPRNDTRYIKNPDVLFDGTNYILKVVLDDLDEYGSRCTPEEKSILESIRPELFGRHDRIPRAHDTSIRSTEVEIIDESNTNLSPGNAVFRKNFAETWIFDTYDINDSGKLIIVRELPDTFTSWKISAFAMNPDYGFAIGKPRELTVIRDFFIKIITPCSIRFGEVLKLEVIAFNMLPGTKKISAGITLTAKENDREPQFEFARFTNPGENCKMTFSNENSQKVTVNVPTRSGNKVEFYIRPLKNGMIRIKIDAVTADSIYVDKIEKEILVETEGIVQRDIYTENFNFTTYNSAQFKYECTAINACNEDFVTYTNVMGNFVLDEPQDFTVTFRMPDQEDLVVHVNESNANKTHFAELGRAKTVNLQIKGTGSGTVYTVFEYFKIDNSLSDNFKLHVTPTTSGSNLEVATCVDYTEDEDDGLIMIDYALPSGYVYDKEHIPKDAKGNNLNVELRKADSFASLTLGNKVKGRHCTTIKAFKLVDVKNMQKASVKVYDNDRRERFAAHFYNVQTTDCV